MPSERSTGLVIAAAAMSVTVLLAELILRLVGYEPWRYSTVDQNEPLMGRPEPQLGWENNPSIFTVSPYHPDGRPIHYTFLANSARRTSAGSQNDAHPKWLILGGSYTQGWAISDEDTWAWKLQARYPNKTVINYGTGGALSE